MEGGGRDRRPAVCGLSGDASATAATAVRGHGGRGRAPFTAPAPVRAAAVPPPPGQDTQEAVAFRAGARACPISVWTSERCWVREEVAAAEHPQQERPRGVVLPALGLLDRGQRAVPAGGDGEAAAHPALVGTGVRLDGAVVAARRRPCHAPDPLAAEDAGGGAVQPLHLGDDPVVVPQVDLLGTPGRGRRRPGPCVRAGTSLLGPPRPSRGLARRPCCARRPPGRIRPVVAVTGRCVHPLEGPRSRPVRSARGGPEPVRPGRCSEEHPAAARPRRRQGRMLRGSCGAPRPRGEGRGRGRNDLRRAGPAARGRDATSPGRPRRRSRSSRGWCRTANPGTRSSAPGPAPRRLRRTPRACRPATG